MTRGVYGRYERESTVGGPGHYDQERVKASIERSIQIKTSTEMSIHIKTIYRDEYTH